MATLDQYGPKGKTPDIKDIKDMKESYWCCPCPMSEATKEKLAKAGFKFNPVIQ